MNRYKEFVKKISIKQVAWLSVIIYLVSLIPLLILSVYAYPCADDFGYGAACHQTWIQTYSVLKTIWQAALTAYDRYFTWQGTFSSVFLFALQPAVWSESCYWITTWIMLVLLTVGVWSVLKIILGRYLGADKYSVMVIASLVLFFTVQCMVDGAQGLFWYNGAAHYMVMHSLYLMLIALQLWQLQKGKCHWWEILVSTLLAFFVSGGNYITALVYAITAVTIMVILVGKKQWKKIIRLIVPLVFFVVGFILNVTAPGNAVRQESFTETPGVIASVLISFSDCLHYVMGEWSDWRVVLMAVLILPAALRIAGRTTFRFRYPLLTVIYSYCCLSAMFTPTVYATGSIGAGRIHNIIFAMFLLLLALNVVYVTGWLVQKGCLQKQKDEKGKEYFVQILLTGICVLGIYAFIEPEAYTSVQALDTILSGEAESFRVVNMERKALLDDGQSREIVLPRYEEIPELLYIDDISTENDWKSNGMCRFYDKDSIVLEGKAAD